MANRISCSYVIWEAFVFALSHKRPSSIFEVVFALDDLVVITSKFAGEFHLIIRRIFAADVQQR